VSTTYPTTQDTTASNSSGTISFVRILMRLPLHLSLRPVQADPAKKPRH
jgi:hypothetical protein